MITLIVLQSDQPYQTASFNLAVLAAVPSSVSSDLKKRHYFC